MAKGRNQERSRKKAGSDERDQGGNESGPSEGGTSRPSSGRSVSPADVARRHQRRFGHN
ncbi:hypothetical protein K378_03130 [Streptomyces sp. Amel2xB2]|uniref:hypothetical protein n=1 Tax=Streptomyces TaxID=1883 RepID=UPI000DBF49F3|nr:MULTISPECIES: hypothetical protein [Streptomyces]RAJ65513.1 hypothetical protein K378_03130 [Streptomyces sp. Amel2xB2]